MWCNLNMLVLAVLLCMLHAASAIEYSNSTALMAMDEKFHGMPVYYKANFPVHMNSAQITNHVRSILEPLTPYIMGSKGDTRLSRVRRQVPLDGSQFLGQLPPLNIAPITETLQVEEYKLPFIVAAQIGDYSFSCAQDNGNLVISNPFLPPANQVRALPSFTEFQFHPRPGIWWWIICVEFESGGAGMGITGVQKPGGDQGINPNALKSLVG